jgi:hypothetical protein
MPKKAKTIQKNILPFPMAINFLTAFGWEDQEDAL